MSFDGVFLHAMTQELQEKLLGGKLVKVQQPYPHEVILVIRHQRHNYPLLLSANPTLARVQITQIPYTNPVQAPIFVMTLRKYLENASLVKIEQIENDRILQLHFRSRDELGDEEDLLVIAEIMGRHSNVFLVKQKDQRIIELIKHVAPDQNRFRLLMPGAQYVQPELQAGFNPFKATLTAKDWQQLFFKLHDLKNQPAKVWQQTFQGLGKDTALEIAQQTANSLDVATLKKKATTFWQSFNHLQPTLAQINHKPQFTAIPYQIQEGTAQHFDSLSALLDAFYGQKAESDRKHQLATTILQRLHTLIKRQQKKLKKLQNTLQKATHADGYRIKGEILTTYLNRVPAHATSVELPNFYEQNHPLKIKLAPELLPNQNAQHYFRRYQKAKKSIKIVQEQIKETQEELTYLQGVLAQVEVGDPKDIEDIRYELEQQGIIRRPQKNKKKRRKVNPAEQFYAQDGTSILVGKNNLQNDQLTLKKARKTDLWLHTKNIPGSHVIVRSAAPSEQTIHDAAMLAAYYSKARHSSQVPVDYVAVKAIHKPNGAKPGFVIYTGQKTAYVTPTEAFVQERQHKPQTDA